MNGKPRIFNSTPCSVIVSSQRRIEPETALRASGFSNVRPRQLGRVGRMIA
jgi:hypothetical protein